MCRRSRLTIPLSRRGRIAIRLLAVLLVGIPVAPSAAAAGESAAASARGCTVEQGQLLIEEGRYKKAIHEFSCVIDAQPTEVDGYRGRIEAQLLLGLFSDAVRDYARVTALVEPAHPDAVSTIIAHYAARLAAAPQDVPALTGASFARWWNFQYAQAIQLLNQLLAVRPYDVYAHLFRGSSRLLGGTPVLGVPDLEFALLLDPDSLHVRFIVADAYTYGKPDPARALQEATAALDGGLDTPRVRAILGAAHQALGDQATAAVHVQTHIQMVTTQLVATAPMAAGTSLSLPLVPGRTYEIPVAAAAGEKISIVTGSQDFWDTILVLLAPDGTPIQGSDDDRQYYAAFEWVADTAATYRVHVTSFEAVSTGALKVMRK